MINDFSTEWRTGQTWKVSGLKAEQMLMSTRQQWNRDKKQHT